MSDFLKERGVFLSKFLQRGRKFGSMWPSTTTVATEMCKYVDRNIPQTIVELGAGTGAITKVALNKMHPESSLICIEADPILGSFLQPYEDKARILICDAQHIAEELNKIGVKKIDLLISGLPLPSLPFTVTEAILRSFQEFAASDTTPFTQLTLIPWIYFNLYKRLFSTVEFNFILKSIPPGGVYHCSGLNPDFKKHLPN